MNQHSKFKVKIAVAIVAASLLFTLTQLTCAYIEKWALKDINNGSDFTSDIQQGYKPGG